MMLIKVREGLVPRLQGATFTHTHTVAKRGRSRRWTQASLCRVTEWNQCNRNTSNQDLPKERSVPAALTRCSVNSEQDRINLWQGAAHFSTVIYINQMQHLASITPKITDLQCSCLHRLHYYVNINLNNLWCSKLLHQFSFSSEYFSFATDYLG